MNAPISPSLTIKTFADLQRRLGDVAPERIRLQPPMGTATLRDLSEANDGKDSLCELVAGILVEKAMGFREAVLAGMLIQLLREFVGSPGRGLVTGPDGSYALGQDLARLPDVAFIAWDRIPGRRMPEEAVPRIVPNLAVEILSPSNTPAEMTIKRREYFAAGVELVWEVDPRARTVTVYTSPADAVVLHQTETLDGGTVLPGFTLALQDLFGQLDVQG